MDHKRWKNPYIDRLDTLPDYIIACSNTAATAADVTILREKIDRFPACYVEIGSGSGKHLINRAVNDPEGCYIGFELRYKRAFRTAEKAQQLQLNNLMVIRTSAAIIDSFFPPDSVEGFYVNFPDPWEKKHWKKHRIINTDYLSIVHRLLKPGGFFSYKTDHREYFRSSVELFQQLDLFDLKAVTEDLHASPHQAGNVYSEFEELFISKGLSPCYLLASKVNP